MREKGSKSECVKERQATPPGLPCEPPETCRGGESVSDRVRECVLEREGEGVRERERGSKRERVCVRDRGREG